MLVYEKITYGYEDNCPLFKLIQSSGTRVEERSEERRLKQKKSHQNKEEINTLKAVIGACKGILGIDEKSEETFYMHNDGL